MASLLFDTFVSASTQDLRAYDSNYTYLSSSHPMQVGTTGLTANSSGSHTGAYSSTGSVGNDQWSTAVINATGSATTTYAGVGVRMVTGSGGTCYYGKVEIVGASKFWTVGYMVNGTATSLAGPNPLSSLAVGDTITLSIVGQNLCFSRNGTALYSVNETTANITTGQPGVTGFGIAGTAITSWSAGDYTLANPAQITSSNGAIGYGASYTGPAQTASFTEGTVTDSMALALSGQTATFNEGTILNAIPIGSQTATFTEGTLTVTKAGDVTLALGQQTASFSEGALADSVSYILDQNLIVVVGQTANFTEGTIGLEVDPAITGQTATFTEGTASVGTAPTLGAQTITSTEGTITASAGNNVTPTLSSQTIVSSQNAFGFVAQPTITAQTATFTVGTIHFSATGDQAYGLGAQTATFKEGLLFPVGPAPGTGPPLFIPPQLGKPVTTRTFSWAEMAMRAWGSEFRAPDHRIYQFSGGNYKDSTDMGTTGIYSPNLGVPDNPPR